MKTNACSVDNLKKILLNEDKVILSYSSFLGFETKELRFNVITRIWTVEKNMDGIASVSTHKRMNQALAVYNKW